VGVVFEDPVATGDARVERATLDVACHLLRAHEEAANGGGVDAGEIAARTGRDLPAPAAEKPHGGGPQAAPPESAGGDVHDGGLYQLVRGPRHSSDRPPGWLDRPMCLG